MTRSVFHVVPIGDLWVVKQTGSVLSSHDLKNDAIKEGIRIARFNKPSQLLTHRANGSLEDERTYDNDPYPPRG